jgi:hypothetical protein
MHMHNNNHTNITCSKVRSELNCKKSTWGEFTSIYYEIYINNDTAIAHSEITVGEPSAVPSGTATCQPIGEPSGVQLGKPSNELS